MQRHELKAESPLHGGMVLPILIRVKIRFYLDAATGMAHVYEHGVDEEEVEDVLWNPGEDRPGA